MGKLAGTAAELTATMDGSGVGRNEPLIAGRVGETNLSLLSPLVLCKLLFPPVLLPPDDPLELLKVIPTPTLAASPISNTTAKTTTMPKRMFLFRHFLGGDLVPIM